MSQKQINDLKSFLEAQGFIEGKHFETHIEQDTNAVSISVKIALDPPKPMPEELLPFQMDGDELERLLWKGNYNGDFKTSAGIEYEIALSRYAASLQDKDPEFIELGRRVRSKDKSEMPTPEEYEAQTDAIWERICADPQIAAWEQDLKDNYL